MSSVVEDAEREFASAQAATATLEVDAAVAHFSAAIQGLTGAGERCRGATACVRLGDVYAQLMGNQTAARAWYARAGRLVADEPPCVEQGWVAIASLGCDVDDPADLLSRAELALDRARRFGDVNLETKALANAGLAHVQAGRVAEGMALLDEAMALACGMADDTDSTGKSVCSFLTACYFDADFERAASWTPTLRHCGLIGLSPGTPVFISNHCDSVQATLLVELGRWGDAEALLTRAIADFEAGMPVPSWHPAIALADLRIRQGRLADADALLLGKDGRLQALLPTARLHLARGDYDLARAAASRGLRLIGNDQLRAAELLAVLVDVELRTANQQGAIDAAQELEARTANLPLPALRARTAAARARVLAAAGEYTSAAAAIEGSVDDLAEAGAPWLQVTLLLDLARLRDAIGDRARAVVEAKAAAAVLAGLDVVLAADDVALLRRLGVDDVLRPGRTVETARLTEEGRWWVATFRDASVRLADTKGLRYLAELVAHAGVERHALDLVERVEGVVPGSRVDRRRLGDAGEVIDSQARAAYRQRIEALRAQIDDALAASNETAAEALQAELDQLVTQLAGAFGLRGRSRRAASAAERARLNVTRALRASISKLADALPEAGTALDRQVRTGLYCIYKPGGDELVRWIVQS